MGMLDLFRRWLVQRNTGSRLRRRTGLSCTEQLESRQVLSAVVVGTTLNVSAATTAPITVAQDASGVHGTVDGTAYNFSSSTTINAINVLGSVGNDKIEIVSVFNSTTLTVNGGAGTNTLISDQTNLWKITGANSGTLNGDSFSNIQNLTGSGFNDTFQFAAGGFVSGIIDGMGGVNSLDYSKLFTGASTTLSTPSPSFNGFDGTSTDIGSGFTSINTLVGSADITDSLTGMNGANVWHISGGNTGDVDGQFFFSSVENLVGGTSTDDFVFGLNGFVSRTINGGSGANTLDYTNRAPGVVTNLYLNSTTAVGGGFSQIGTIIGSSGTDTLIGNNQANVWNITGANAGNVGLLNSTTPINFQGFENLTGGSVTDAFKFTNAGSESGTVSGFGGVDTLDYSARTTAVTVNLQTSKATAIGGTFTAIEGFVGGTSTNTLIGTNTATTWNITGTNAGNVNNTYTFSAFQDLTGGTVSDTFAFQAAGAVTGATDGGLGTNNLDFSARHTAVTVNLKTSSVTSATNTIVDQRFVNVTNFVGAAQQYPADTLLGADTTNTWDITGVNSGDVNGLITFSSFSNLTGGLGSDIFHLVVGGQITGTVNGSRVPGIGEVDTGNNWLDYSSYTLPVVVNLALATTTPGNSTNVGLAINIQNVHGGSDTNTLTGNGVGNVLVGGQSADTITAGSGRSLLIGGLGADTLTGGAAQDIVIGGYTNFDSNFNALQSILAEWQSTTETLAVRVSHLRTGGGLNGTNDLVADSTVHSDSASNIIKGGLGPNWLWGGPSELKDRTSQDIVDTPIDNAPILSGATAITYTASQAPVAADSGLTITATTTTTLASATVSMNSGFSPGHDVLNFAPTSATGNIVGSYNATTGVLTLTSMNSTATVAQFQAALRSVTYYNNSATPTTTTRTVSFQVYDGFFHSNSLVNTIFINFAPTLTGASTISYAPLQDATVINSGIVVTDANSVRLTSATVKITGYYQSSQDVLSFTGNANTGTIVGSFNAISGVLTLTSSGSTATVAQYQAALRLVTYQDVASSPLQVNRTVAFQVIDGIAASNVLNSVVAFAPILTGSNTLTYTQGQAAAAIDPNIVATYPSGSTFTSATVQIGTNYNAAQDVLGFVGNASTGSIIGIFNSATGTLTLKTLGTPATVAQYQAALALVTYRNTSGALTPLPRTVNFQVTVGNAVSNILQSTINFA